MGEVGRKGALKKIEHVESLLECFSSYSFAAARDGRLLPQKKIKIKNNAQEFVINLRCRLPRPWLVSVSVTGRVL